MHPSIVSWAHGKGCRILKPFDGESYSGACSVPSGRSCARSVVRVPRSFLPYETTVSERVGLADRRCCSACQGPSSSCIVRPATMSETDFTYDVFLSHSAKDKAVVRAAGGAVAGRTG